jgi:hypothetical protein
VTRRHGNFFLVNDNGDPLRFGMMHYTNATSTFRECVKPRDVKTALVLLDYLFLEHHIVEKTPIRVEDKDP